MRIRAAHWLGLVAVSLAFVAAPAFAADGVRAKRKKNRALKVRKIRPKNRATFVDPDVEIRIRFTRPVDESTITPANIRFGRIFGDDVAWGFRLEKKGKQVVLIPATHLSPGVDYEVRVQFGVAASAGQALKREKSARFFTDPNFVPTEFLAPEQFTNVQSRMSEGRAAHSATRLPDGTVLLAGGQSDFVNISGTADRYIPGAEAFQAAATRMPSPRAYHAAAPTSGSVLLLGGWDGVDASDANDIFDPAANGFRAGAPMQEKRDFLAAVTLEDERVLVVGGLRYTNTGAEFSETAEIFDPVRGTWEFTNGPPERRRAGHVLTRLDDGTVLVTGGLSITSIGGPHAEIFDPRTGTFRETAFRPSERRSLHTATVLSNGLVFIADGGNGRMELYDPNQERFFSAGGASFVRRTRATASLLPGNQVLLAGGFDSAGDGTIILDGMDLYQAGAGEFGNVIRTSVVFPEPRAGHTATTLVDGTVIFAGGFGSSSEESLDTGILLNPVR